MHKKRVLARRSGCDYGEVMFEGDRMGALVTSTRGVLLGEDENLSRMLSLASGTITR